MLDKLKEETNITQTENLAKAYKTTKSYMLDFFAQAGALRKRPIEEIESLFSKAFAENSELALKALFYFRDIREGQGERRTFRVILEQLANFHSDRLKPLLKYIPEYGRWDDLLVLLDSKLKKEVVQLIKKQYEEDVKAKKPSLLGKWLPSENTSSHKTVEKAKKLRKALGLKSKEYRKSLAVLREKINIIERPLSFKEWKKIEYDKVPSKAGLKYKKAFFKHDEDRYTKYLESVKKGEKKINVKDLYPYEIAGKILTHDDRSETLDVMWNNLPNYVKEDENALVVADTSGSMMGVPITISTSLALYFAERNKGAFKNHFITFSKQPELQEVIGKTLYEKISNLSRAHWDCNTDIEKVFLLILNTAVKHKVKKSELPSKIYIISDMEFDYCASDYDKTIYEVMKTKYKENGYKLPEIVFWNVDARNTQFPVIKDDIGVQLVSGASPILFKQIVSGISAYSLMMEILTKDRYKVIK